MNRSRIFSILLIIIAVAVANFLYTSEKDGAEFPFKYGLDLNGGTHLTYRADTSQVQAGDVDTTMDTLRKTIERRVNIFGVSEPIVQVEKGSVFSDNQDENRLIIELPGVTDIDEAIKAIGKTPLLEFRIQNPDFDFSQVNDSLSEEELIKLLNEAYLSTGLTGASLKRSSVAFGQSAASGPIVALEFNSEGAKLFEEITKNNIGNVLAIFLDGQLVSNPVIQQEIAGGQAQITGQFTIEEAQEISQNLNFGALPVPIELIETQTVGASLGAATLNSGVIALIYAYIIIFVFFLIYYRLPGLVASISLAFYIIMMLALFKLIPVTLTASGIAGFILSLGMAVDANVLIFARFKEELSQTSNVKEALRNGFKRAWTAIRDGNITSIIAALILFWFSGASIVKGFALVFALGVLVSMISAVAVSRTLLLALVKDDSNKAGWLFRSGFKNK